jgi:hypothetical protein
VAVLVNGLCSYTLTRTLPKPIASFCPCEYFCAGGCALIEYVAIHERANPSRGGGAKPTGLSRGETARLPKEALMQAHTPLSVTDVRLHR